MIIRTTRAALAAGALALGLAQAAAAAAQPAPSILTTASVPIGAVTAMPDVTYATIPGFRPLKMDVYRPTGATGPLPLVLFLHGGGWAGGTPRGGPFGDVDGAKTLAELSARGYVVASISYRLVGEAKFPAQAQDVRTAMRFLRAQSARFGIDPNNVVMTGASAGGFLAAQAGVACGDASLDAPMRPGPNGAPPPAPRAAGSECVKGVVAFYPVVDLPSLAKEPAPGGGSSDTETSPIAVFVGCKPSNCSPQTWAASTVVGRVDAKDPPFLIFHGDADTLVTIEQSKMLDAALKKAGVPSEFVVVPGANHIFPGLGAAKQREILDKTFAFIDRQTGKTR